MALVERLEKQAKEADGRRWATLQFGLRCYNWQEAAACDLLLEAAKYIREHP